MSSLYICNIWNNTIISPLCDRNQYVVLFLGILISPFKKQSHELKLLLLKNLSGFSWMSQNVPSSPACQGSKAFLLSMRRSPYILSPVQAGVLVPPWKEESRYVSLTVRMPCAEKASEIQWTPHAATQEIYPGGRLQRSHKPPNSSTEAVAHNKT